MGEDVSDFVYERDEYVVADCPFCDKQITERGYVDYTGTQRETDISARTAEAKRIRHLRRSHQS